MDFGCLHSECATGGTAQSAAALLSLASMCSLVTLCSLPFKPNRHKATLYNTVGGL